MLSLLEPAAERVEGADDGELAQSLPIAGQTRLDDAFVAGDRDLEADRSRLGACMDRQPDGRTELLGHTAGVRRRRPSIVLTVVPGAGPADATTGEPRFMMLAGP